MAIPHSKQLLGDFTNFIEDLKTSFDSHLEKSKTDTTILGSFKVATAGYAVLDAFANEPEGENEELLRAAAGICRRVLILMASRQVALSRIELRRLIECVLWYAYFVDHEVEREEFINNPQRGWEERGEKPIAATVSAPISTFFLYAKERLEKDPSCLGKQATDKLRTAYGNLSSEVHAAMGAVHPSGSLALSFDKYDPSIGKKLFDEFRQIISSAVLLAAAIAPMNMSKLDAINRGWFDWLVSPETAKRIRGEEFGISRKP